jgi:hypothetical protein
VTHETLVSIAAATHAAILVGTSAAYFKFGDRTDVLAKSLQGTDETMRELRRLIAQDLAETLQNDLSHTTTVSAIILDATTEAYIERAANIFVGERYRDCVRRFVEENANRIVDCRGLVTMRHAWSRSARRLSWIILALGCYEAIVAGALAFLDRTEVVMLPSVLIKWAAGPTAAMIFMAGLSLAQMLRTHDRISEIRERYVDV